jgi:hypothetical protein
MTSWLGLLLLGVVLVVFLRAVRRGTELFRVRVRDGEMELERGRLPPALFHEVGDIVRLHRIQNAKISAVLSGGAARLVFEHDGAAAGAEQPLRNVLGRFTTTQLRSGGRRAT